MKRPISRAVFITLAALALYTAWAFLRPDEELKPELVPAFANAAPRYSDATIGLAGLEAPMGVDFMQHGRLLLAALEKSDDWLGATRQINHGKEVLAFKWNDSVECWLFGKRDAMPGPVRETCATSDEVGANLRENDELMRRYRLVQKMPVTPDGANFKAQVAINLAKLNAIDIARDSREGRAEQAYAKWRDAHIHQARMAGYGGIWVMSAINLVNEGLGYGALGLMLENAPELMTTHREELLALLKPRDLGYYNLPAVMLSESRWTEREMNAKGVGRYIRVNRQRNRYDDYSQELNDLISRRAVDKASVNELRQRSRALGVRDVVDPINAVAWQFATDVGGWRGELIESMQAKEAQRRLFTLKVLLMTAKTPDDAVGAFLKSAPAELRSPADGNAFGWDAKKRSLVYRVPEKPAVVEVFL